MFNLFYLFKRKRYSDISNIMKEEVIIAKSYEDILIEKNNRTITYCKNLFS